MSDAEYQQGLEHLQSVLLAGLHLAITKPYGICEDYCSHFAEGEIEAQRG
jgi:hypothetical protein